MEPGSLKPPPAARRGPTLMLAGLPAVPWCATGGPPLGLSTGLGASCWVPPGLGSARTWRRRAQRQNALVQLKVQAQLRMPRPWPLATAAPSTPEPRAPAHALATPSKHSKGSELQVQGVLTLSTCDEDAETGDVDEAEQKQAQEPDMHNTDIDRGEKIEVAQHTQTDLVLTDGLGNWLDAAYDVVLAAAKDGEALSAGGVYRRLAEMWGEWHETGGMGIDEDKGAVVWILAPNGERLVCDVGWDSGDDEWPPGQEPSDHG